MRDSFFPELHIFSIALHKEHALLFEKELEYKDYKPKFEESKLDGEFIGFDILGSDWGKFHTYLCNGLDETIQVKFLLKINKWGLIDNLFDEVRQFAEYINDLPENERGEPVLWLPFAVYRHD